MYSNIDGVMISSEGMLGFPGGPRRQKTKLQGIFAHEMSEIRL